MSPGSRPATINRCPFFWRLVLVTLVAMPLYWLVWVPFAFVVGFPFAARPNVFHGEYFRAEHDDWNEVWTWYACWPRFPSGNKRDVAMPVFLLIPVILWLLLSLAWWGLKELWILNTKFTLGGHTVLFWEVCIIAVCVAHAVLRILNDEGKMKFQKPEWYQMAQDSWKERKEGICPTYKVID